MRPSAMIDPVERFLAEMQFRFDAESLETSAAALRRLQRAAEGAGFELVRGKVIPAPPEQPKQPGEWTSYGPTRPDA